jgi:hypothetical protein
VKAMKLKHPFPAYLVFILSVLLFCGCRQSNFTNVELTSLLINDEPLPPGWLYSDGPIGVGLDEDRSTDSVRISFYSDIYPDTFGVIQNIYRFKSVQRAKDDYADEAFYYRTRNYYNPQEWGFESLTADESRIFCRNDSVISGCVWIARYDCIVIEFTGWLIPGRMTLVDMENIVYEIDEKVSKPTLNE